MASAVRNLLFFKALAMPARSRFLIPKGIRNDRVSAAVAISAARAERQIHYKFTNYYIGYANKLCKSLRIQVI